MIGHRLRGASLAVVACAMLAACATTESGSSADSNGAETTREEALAERDERRKLWNKKSPSQQGRARGQPDLGARMQVMLDKIQRSS